MSQNDFNIANQGFPSFRSDLNSALQALASTSSGATAPATPYANQLWYDTATDLLKIRNEANSAWITLFAVSADGFAVEDKIVHSGDTNTSIRFPAADTVTVETNGAERLRIDSAGNVGIGTTTPTVQLQVSSSTTSSVLKISNSTTGSAFGDGLDLIVAGTAAYVWNRENGELLLATNNTERMRIDSAGNVGIGTTSPAEQLHITGNLRVGSAVLATPTGSAPMYAARAWVSCLGASPSTIQASGNVSSVTFNVAGDHTINLTTAMPDENYSFSAAPFTSGGAISSYSFSTKTTTALRIRTAALSSGSLVGPTSLHVAIFR